MPGDLQTQLQQLRQRVLQLCCMQGAVVALGTVVTALFVVGLLDYWLHLDSMWIRFALLLTILSGTAYIVWQTIVRPLRAKLTDTYLAEQIERYYPALNDRLVSVVQFTEQRRSQRIGSPQLQKEVIEQTLEEVRSIDFADILETRYLNRAAAIVAGVCVVAVIVTLSSPAMTRLALGRLAFPFSASPWPRTTELQLVDAKGEPLSTDPAKPLYVVSGSAFELFVRNIRGPVPDDLRVQFRERNSPSLGSPPNSSRPASSRPVLSQSMRKIKYENTSSEDEAEKEGGEEPATGKPETWGITTLSTSEPLEFRVTGGDDHDMPFYQLVPVKAPELESLQVTLIPPLYTAVASKQLPAGKGDVESVLGTRVDINATVNKPVQSAVLKIADLYSIPIDILDNGQRLRVAFEIDTPGKLAYWFVFTDDTGFENRHTHKYQLTGIEDRVPHVVIEDPVSNLTATAIAELPLQIDIDDDFGIQATWLGYQRAGDSPETFTRRPLFASVTTSPTQQENPTLHEKLTHLWPLVELQLKPGDQLIFHAESADFLHTESQPHLGRSSPRTITIVSEKEKLGAIAGQQSDLLLDLQRLQQEQRHLQHQVQQLQLQMKNAGTLQSADVDLLNRVERDQQQLAEQLAESEDSIEARIKQTQAELSHNRLSAPQLESQLTALGQTIARLRERQLPEIARDLTAVRKQAELSRSGRDSEISDESDNSNEPDSSDEEKDKPAQGRQQAQTLGNVERNQAEIIDALDQSLSEMSQWIDKRQLTQALREIADEQAEVMEQTRELGRDTLSKPLSQLSPQQQADLSRLGKRQEQLGEEFDELKKRLEQSSVQNPTSGTAEMARQLEQQAFEKRMQQAARDIADNSVGEALQKQEELLDGLKQFQDELVKQGPPDTEERLDKLKQLEQAVARQQQNQADALEQLQSIPDDQSAQKQEELAPELQRLQQEIEKLQQELQRLQLRDSSDTAQRARQNLQQAEQSLSQPDASAQQALKQAQQETERLQNELREQRQQLQQQLEYESILKLADRLKTVTQRHQNLMTETARLEAERQSRGRWSRGQLISLKQLVGEQQALVDTVIQISEKVASVEVVAVALNQIVNSMQQTANRLAERQTDQQTTHLQDLSQRRLVNLMVALDGRASPSASDEQPPMPEQQPGPDGNPPPGEMFPAIAQLRVTKMLQQDLLDRTRQLQQQLPPADEWTPDQMEQVQQLAREQAELAELIERLLAPAEAGLSLPTDEQDLPEVDEKNNSEPPALLDVLE